MNTCFVEAKPPGGLIEDLRYVTLCLLTFWVKLDCMFFRRNCLFLFYLICLFDIVNSNGQNSYVLSLDTLLTCSNLYCLL